MSTALNSNGNSITFSKKSAERNGHNGISLSDSSLDWYKLTENARYVLSQVVGESINLQFDELQKAVPDQNRIQELQALAFRVNEISRDAKNFKSKARMQKILEEYSNFELGL